MKTIINKTSLGLDTNNTSNNEKATDNEINKIPNTEISINTKYDKDTSNTCMKNKTIYIYIYIYIINWN